MSSIWIQYTSIVYLIIALYVLFHLICFIAFNLFYTSSVLFKWYFTIFIFFWYTCRFPAIHELRLTLEWNQAQGKKARSKPLSGRSKDQSHNTTNALIHDRSIACKTDAAWDKTRNVAGLAWNFLGVSLAKPIEDLIVHEYVASSLIAEALDLLAFFGSAKDLGFTNLDVFSDNTTLIEARTKNWSESLVIYDSSHLVSPLYLFRISLDRKTLSQTLLQKRRFVPL